jgi:4-carboxymuconolactone decarboxylase
MASAREHYDTWPQAIAAMKEAAPEVARAFGGLFQKLMGAGALSVREKELIALVIGLALRCEACIYAHIERHSTLARRMSRSSNWPAC